MLQRQNVTRMNVELSSINRDTVPQDYSQLKSALYQAPWKGDIDCARSTCADKTSPGEVSLRWHDRPSSAPVAGATGISQSNLLSRNSKSLKNMQLPPIKSLVIVLPQSEFLLTPPYETDIKWNASCQDPSELPPTTPIFRPTGATSEGTTPETPQVHEFISESTTNTPNLAQAPIQGTMTEGAGLEEDKIENLSWFEQAVEIAGKPGPFRNQRTLTDHI